MMLNALHTAPWLNTMARVFDRKHAPLYAVGGAVRNPLMGLPISDVDVCGPLLPEEICAVCEGTEVRAKVRAAAFGTVELYVGDHMAEYTAWREDSYLAGHRPDQVTFTADIRADARRRDFSVNALYQRLHDGWTEDVLDPTGGLRHMRMGMLHTATADPDLILSHDGQRILRAARFQAQLDLRPTKPVMESLRRSAHLVGELSGERMRADVEKLLMADGVYPQLRRRAPAAASGLRTLADCGAWEHLFPGMAYDDEAALALGRFRGTLPQRMALLFRSADEETLRSAMARLRFANKDTACALRCHAALRHPDAPLYDLAQLGVDALASARSMLLAIGQDAAPADEALAALRGKPLSVRELAVSGSDLKPLFERTGRPFKEMGAALDRLWRMALAGEIANERDALLREAQK